MHRIYYKTCSSSIYKHYKRITKKKSIQEVILISFNLIINIFFSGIYYSNFNCTLGLVRMIKGNYLDKLCFYNYPVVKTKSDNNNNI